MMRSFTHSSFFAHAKVTVSFGRPFGLAVTKMKYPREHLMDKKACSASATAARAKLKKLLQVKFG